jgi:hypothetical protein
VAVFATLGAWLLAHLLEIVPGRPWSTTTAYAAGTVILLAAGAFTVRTSADVPVGSTAAYGVDADSNTAFVGARAMTPWATSALRRAMGDSPDVRPPAWFARAFAVAKAAPPPGAGIGKAQAVVLSDSAHRDSSWVRVRIVPAEGTRAISLRADSGVVLAATIDGRAVITDGYRAPQRGRFGIEYVAPPADGFEIVFFTRVGQPVDLAVVSYQPGIPRVPGVEVPTRPAGVIPIQRGDYTLVHQRVRIR